MNLQMHFEIVIECVWRCTWRACTCQLGGRDLANLEMYLESVVVRAWRP